MHGDDDQQIHDRLILPVGAINNNYAKKYFGGKKSKWTFE